MNILITGGAGYVGSVLTPMVLAAGHHVRVIDHLAHGGGCLLGVWSHPRFEFIRGDIRDRKTIDAALSGRNAVVHLAALVGDPACAREPDRARTINFDASVQLIESSRKHGVERFVFASTCSNYGRMADPDCYVNEETELRPVSLYAETKVAVEQELLRSGRDNGWCPTPLRFATIYGVSPRMRFDLTVNEFTLELLTKKRLTVYGERFWRPYVHVSDAACAIQLVLDSPPEAVAGCVFNVGATDQNFQKQQIVELIRPYVRDAVVEFVERTEDPRDYRVSFSRISAQLGFRNHWTVPQGIEEIARLVRNQIIADCYGAGYRN